MNLTSEGAIAAIKAENSTAWPGWRRVSAAALLALADDGDRVWMTTEEFVAWRAFMGISGARHTRIRVREMIGMAHTRLKTVMDGGRINRVESLACAHSLFGLTLPIEEGDSEAFAGWFPARFGAQTPIARYLRFPNNHIGDRIRGYVVKDGKRIPRAPEVDLIRALDWVDVMGPWSPYGEKPVVKAWPGQEVY